MTSNEYVSKIWSKSANDKDGMRLGYTTQQHYFAALIIEQCAKACDDKIKAKNDLISELAKLARHDHYYCDDCWYTCPKHEEGCCNEEAGNECNCGADEHNKKIDELYRQIIYS